MNTDISLLGELDLLVTEGFYPDRETLIQDAFRALLRSKPELQHFLATTMYKHGKVSLTRGAEIAGLDIEGFKELLREVGVARTVPSMGKAAVKQQVIQLLRIRTQEV